MIIIRTVEVLDEEDLITELYNEGLLLSVRTGCVGSDYVVEPVVNQYHDENDNNYYVVTQYGGEDI